MNEIEVKKSDIEKSGVFALQDFAIGESVYRYKHGKFIGKKEVGAKTVAVRQRTQGDLGSMDINKFIDTITKEINAKVL